MTFQEELKRAIHEYFEEPMATVDNTVMPIIEKWCFPKPVYENGEPVQFGDKSATKISDEHSSGRVIGFKFFEGHYEVNNSIAWNNYKYTEHVKRPKPPAIAADGLPLEVGDTVYELEEGHEMKVTGFNSHGKPFVTDWVDGEDVAWEPSELTHTKPAFDADGEIIREGDEVYFIGKKGFFSPGSKFRIFKVVDEETVIVDEWGIRADPSLFSHSKPVLDADGVVTREGDTVYFLSDGDVMRVTEAGEYLVEGTLDDGEFARAKPHCLTHTPPDTLERIREDATLPPRKYYNDHIGHDVGLRDDEYVFTRVHQDLIERTIKVMECGR